MMIFVSLLFTEANKLISTSRTDEGQSFSFSWLQAFLNVFLGRDAWLWTDCVNLGVPVLACA